MHEKFRLCTNKTNYVHFEIPFHPFFLMNFAPVIDIIKKD